MHLHLENNATLAAVFVKTTEFEGNYDALSSAKLYTLLGGVLLNSM